MSMVTDQITSLQNQTEFTQANSSSSSNEVESDYTMFLTLMLEQLENQDPTEPMDNSEWLSQLAQYSTLEQMTQMNANMEDIMTGLDNISTSVGTNAVITQTLSLVGKEVTIEYTETVTDENGDPVLDENGNEQTEDKTISGVVTEAKFDGGIGYVKVGDEYYSISNVTSIREPVDETADNSGSDEAVEAAAAVYSAQQRSARSMSSAINSIL